MKMTVRIGDKIYQVRIGDPLARPIRVDVEGEVFEVWPEERYPLGDSAQPATTASAPIPPFASPPSPGTYHPQARELQVTAPIPGVIVEVLVSPGDEVVYGQELCVLEAMKMKNSIRSARDGVIDRVLVAVGEQVSQNQALLAYRAEGA